jgi:glycerol uptake facilitator-like aquaporin
MSKLWLVIFCVCFVILGILGAIPGTDTTPGNTQGYRTVFRLLPADAIAWRKTNPFREVYWLMKNIGALLFAASALVCF